MRLGSCIRHRGRLSVHSPWTVDGLLVVQLMSIATVRFDLPATLAQQLEERAYGLTTKALVVFRSSKNETVRKTVRQFFIEPINDKRPARWLT